MYVVILKKSIKNLFVGLPNWILLDSIGSSAWNGLTYLCPARCCFQNLLYNWSMAEFTYESEESDEEHDYVYVDRNQFGGTVELQPSNEQNQFFERVCFNLFCTFPLAEITTRWNQNPVINFYIFVPFELVLDLFALYIN